LAFVCLFVSEITQKVLGQFSTKFNRNVAHVPQRKPLDFGGNPDHIVMFWLGLGGRMFCPAFV